MMLLPGIEKVGPYTLVREIGKGSFGVVWLAERRGRLATTRVALKIPVNLSKRDFQYLIREAEIWIRSTGHPNVMPIIEAEEYADSVVIVTEFAQDGSLESCLQKSGGRAPTIDAAIHVTSGILTGLAYLHAHGVIHRDLKPANILLQGNIPRIADFGLARLSDNFQHSHSIAGTPEYMAPEAWQGNRSEQSDLWSVGVMFYEMLTGRTPFPNDRFDILRHAVEFSDPDPLPDALPDRIQTTIFTALRKDPATRFQTAQDMLASLQQPSPALVVADAMTTRLANIQALRAGQP